ncbi:MAG: tetratricopeptide repeat protein, partial [Niabella sp.]|nr:tetratricopeptide repeat protein [Niabella sp.]
MATKKSGILSFFVLTALLCNYCLYAQKAKRPNADLILKEALKQTGLGNYDQAATLANKGLRVSPNYLDIQLLLARIYTLKEQPDEALKLYDKILTKHPANKTALLGKADVYQREKNYDAALQLYESLSAKYPKDSIYMLKQLGTYESQKQFARGVPVANRLQATYPATPRFKELSNYYKIAAAQLYYKSGNYDSAQYYFANVLKADPGNKEALSGQADVYQQQKNYDAARQLYDRLLSRYPSDSTYLLKQLGTYESEKQYNKAVPIANRLRVAYPSVERFKELESYYKIAAAQRYFNTGNHDSAQYYFTDVLKADPNNKEAMTGKADVYQREKNYDAAQQLYKQLSTQDPKDSTYMLKQLGIYELKKQYSSALPVSARLEAAYPGVSRFRELNNYFKIAAAQLYRKSGQSDSAQYYFADVLKTDSSNKDALYGMAALEEQQKHYAQALDYYDKYYVNQSADSAYLIRKANLLAAQGKYKEAANASRQLTNEYPNNTSFKNFDADKQWSIKKSDQVGLLNLHSFFDNGASSINILSGQYLHRFNQYRSSIVGRVNYSNRATGQGVQFEAESYLYHNKKHYSFLGIGVSNGTVFPGFKATYSLYSSLNKGWELETGARYIGADSTRLYFGVLGISKETDNNWFNFRNYAIYNNTSWSSAHIFTWRYYLNKRRDYTSVILGLGTSPDDRSRNYSPTNFSRYLSKNIGLGYQKNFKNFSFSLTGVW